MPSPSPSLEHQTVEAGAGAGKTRLLIDEIFKSSLEHFNQHKKFPRVMITTFTRKAAGEVKERLIKKAALEDTAFFHFMNDPSRFFVSTLHGILYSFLLKNNHRHFEIMNHRQKMSLARKAALLSLKKENAVLFESKNFPQLIEMLLEYSTRKGYEPDLKPLSIKEVESRWIQTIKNVCENNPSLKQNSPLMEKVSRSPLQIKKEDIENLKLESKIKKQLLNLIQHHPEKLKLWALALELFHSWGEDFKKHFEFLKNEEDLILIEDLELKTLELIRCKSPLITRFREMWDFWFIDEYQDISPNQEKILSTLLSGAKKSFVVGDPQQSIYLFRGADPEVFERRKKHTKGASQMWTNQRASAPLISFFNDLFESRFHPMEPPPKIKNEAAAPKPAAHFLTHPVEESGMRAVCEHLKQQLESGAGPGSICLLLQTNVDVSEWDKKLKREGFPVGAHSMIDLKREVLDFLFLIKFLINPFDNENLIALLRTPYFFIPDDKISLYCSRTKALWPSIKEAPFPAVKRLSELIKGSTKEGLSETLLSSFRDDFMKEKNLPQETNLWPLLLELKEKEKEAAFNHLQWIQDKQNAAKDPGEGSPAIRPDLIQIMTVHQSKGLEFDHIILPRIDKKLKPPLWNPFFIHPEKKRWAFLIQDENGNSLGPIEKSDWRIEESKKEVQELDRLFYTAVTRAKKSIAFIGPFETLEKAPSLDKTWLGRFDYFKSIARDLNSLKAGQNLVKEKNNYRIELSHPF